MCVDYGLANYSQSELLTLCDNGQWTDLIGGDHGIVPRASRYVIVMYVKDIAVQFIINTVYNPIYEGGGTVTPFNQDIYDVSLDTASGLPPGASVDIQSFVLTANQPPAGYR